jgi:dephospho-CoA kinase
MGRKQGDPFLVIGGTGGIGAGKSTVSHELARHGARLLDADALSRAATAPGEPAVEEIAARFGEGILTPEGMLNRQALAGIVFSDPAGRADLEEIVHRQVVAAIDRSLAQWRAECWQGVVALDVPIPVERGFLDGSDEVWVVTSPEPERLRRVMARSGWSEAEVRRRMAAQLKAEDWRRLADRVVQNDGNPRELAQQVEGLLAEACRVWGHPCGKVPRDDTLDGRASRRRTGPQEEQAMKEPMFERDLLYPTDVQFEPGSVHIRVYAPESDGRMPVHVEAKTDHDLLDHLEAVMTLMQSDIFDRIRMDIRRSGAIYLHPYGNGETISVRYNENGRSHTTKVIHEDRKVDR